MEALTNNYALNKNELVDAILDDKNAKDNFLMISVAWIKYLASASINPVLRDGRNKIACNKGYKIVIQSAFKKYSKVTNYDGFVWTDNISVPVWEDNHSHRLDLGGLFVTESWNIHKTLQQTFSSVVFLFIAKCCEDLQMQISEALEEENWYKMPVI